LIARPGRIANAVGAAGVFMAACGSEDPATQNDTIERPNTVVAAGTDRLVFEPDKFTIPAGKEVTLKLTASSIDHDFVIEGAAGSGATKGGHQAEDSKDLHVAHADRGKTVTATFRIDKSGSYTVYCSVPGHRDAGAWSSEALGASEGLGQ
jgi:uncharacterized cupredoxin-like copper-binding protein